MSYFRSVDPGDPAVFPVGSRVRVPQSEDHHFFRLGETGTVVRHADRKYLGVIVELDHPFLCDHGSYRHEVREFNFNARDLAPETKPAAVKAEIERRRS